MACSGARLLLDRDWVGAPWRIRIVELEHPRRDSHADGIAFTAITVHAARPSVTPGVWWLPQGLPQLNNIAGLCQVSTAHGQSVSVAASSIIMANHFLASSSCRLVISAILRSR